MEINIEQLPFGVAVINKVTGLLQEANSSFFRIFSMQKDSEFALENCEPLSLFRDLIEEHEEEYKIRDFKYKDDSALDIVVRNNKDKIIFYFMEKSLPSPTVESNIMAKLLKLREERQQFITISTELKTKCDIIEILRKREKEYMMHLKDVMNNISEGLIVLDAEGKYNFCNKAVYSVLDVAAEDLKNYPYIFLNYEIEQINENEDSLDYREIFNHNKHIKNLIILLRHKETGERKFIEFNNAPIKNENNEFIYSIVTLKDVTDIKLHERLVQEQASFIRDIVNTMDIPIAVVSYPQLELTLANEQLGKIVKGNFSSLNEKIRGRSLNVREVFKGEAYKEISNSLLECGVKGQECCYSPFEFNVDGEKKYYKITFKPLKDRNEKTNLILINAMDITEEVSKSIHLENITLMKDEFFTLISHELRTPLTVIHSSLQLAYNVYGKEITPNIHKNLLRINQNCSRLLKLINNILDISKAEAGFLTINSTNFDIIEVTEYIVNSINTYAKIREIELDFDSNCNNLTVNMDKDKFEKILLNLLSNAMKFTPAGKTIRTRIEERESKIILSVKDEGIGIPQEKLQSIFDRFAQVNSSLSRRAEGTGIGLSLVKKFVEIMGGTIEVKSTVDIGTEFIVSFNKLCLDFAESENFSLMDINVHEKINIEFSDVD